MLGMDILLATTHIKMYVFCASLFLTFKAVDELLCDFDSCK